MIEGAQQVDDTLDKAFGKESHRQMFGEEVRKLRKARGKTIAEVAMAIGRSVSFVSQFERGNADVSVTDLRSVAYLLGVPLGWFFMSDTTPANERGRVVRSGSRRHLGTVTTGKIEELLSPNISGAFE